MPDVSVILCTWNNCGRLRKTLGSFRAIDFPDGITWELVVVDNNSNDNTRPIVNEYVSHLPIRYVFEARQGLSHARNAGLAVASGSLLIFTDDDVTLRKDWLVEYWEAFKRMPEGCFWGGPVYSQFECEGVDKELIGLGPPSVRGLDWGATRRQLKWPRECFISANWACTREALDKAGRFDTRLGLNPAKKHAETGEETQLMGRLVTLGYKPWYLPCAALEHYVPASKTTIRHITERARALGRYRRRERLANASAGAAIRPWMYRKLLVLSFGWLLAIATGQKAYNERLKLYEFLGELDAYKEFRKSARRKKYPSA